MVLDSSGSMNNENRWSLTKIAVKKVLDTLTDYDYVGLVLFHSGHTPYPEEDNTPNLHRATSDVKDKIIRFVNLEHTPSGRTNFEVIPIFEKYIS